MKMEMDNASPKPELSYMPSKQGLRIRKHIRDFWWLLLGQLFSLRIALFWYIFQIAFVPLSFLVFLWLFVGRVRPEAMVYIISGSLVMNVTLGSMLSLGQTIGSLKDANAYEYYATLPISKITFLAALATRGVLLTLPSALGLFVIGVFFFELALTPAVLVVLIISAYAMSGLGAFIGFWSPNGQAASLATQIVQPLIVLLAPVFFPLEQLPYPLQFTSRFLPTTYAAIVLRKTAAGGSVVDVWLEILLLLGFAMVSLILVPLKLPWRGR